MRVWIVLLLLLTCCTAHCQEKDSSERVSPKKHGEVYNLLYSLIARKANDSSMLQSGVVIANEVSFIPYNGKVIRQILVKESRLNNTSQDTTKEINFFGKEFVKHLYRNTRESVIRDNLFIKPGTPLNASLVADNERYLRSLNYIYDARILPMPVDNELDSVDLVVITRNFVSIIAELNDIGSDHFKAKVGDANIAGTAQRIEFTALVEKRRGPNFGYEILYQKNTIKNSFINASIGYSQIKPNLYDGSPDEHTWQIKVERPLVSQYLHYAGALTVSQSQTVNHYSKPDTVFYDYQYHTLDLWAGYNLGIKKFKLANSTLRRHFVSVRYLRNKFSHVPYQVKDVFNFRFNDREAILGQFTFFRQKFYKTNYIFGFGITEDVPYGYNIALTSGWYRQSRLERLYTGVDANHYVVTGKGNVLQYFLRAGGFLHKSEFQDVSLLLGSSAFSKIYHVKSLKMRQYLRLSYTRQFNRLGMEPLNLSNIFGLSNIPTDSTSGKQRISMHTESILFLNYKLLGFKFAPIASVDITYFTPEQKPLNNTGLYFGLGGGVRTRNENLLFGTTDLRFVYFPPRAQQKSNFQVIFTTNLRLRSNFNYVKAPDIIQVNSDIDNPIY